MKRFSFTFALAAADHLKHLGFRQSLDFLDGSLPFACFFFAFLLHHVAEDFCTVGLFSIE